VAVSALARLAASAPVPVFPVVGAGARRQVQALRRHAGLELTASPRHATVLLVAGALPPELVAPARHVHDQLPGPRAVLRWADDGTWEGPHEHLSGDGDVLDALRRLHAAVVTGERPSAPPMLPADHPHAWQGVGPYGHGGEGMMGGAPYGRPLPMPPVEGRDGLALDRLDVDLGPFLPGFPPGLQLRVGLQGDVLESVEARPNPFLGDPGGWDGRPLPELSADAGLLQLGELLAVLGLDALARRASRLAVDGDARGRARLRRALERSRGLVLATRGIGEVELGGHRTDAVHRWQAWLQGEGTPAGTEILSHLGHVLHGAELGEAVTTLVSLDVDLEHAAPREV
jgi:hypothetical protein